MVTLNDRPEWTILTDDGSVEGDTAGDGLFMGCTFPLESLGFQVSDSGRVLGNLEVVTAICAGGLNRIRYNEFGLSGVGGDETVKRERWSYRQRQRVNG